MDHLIPYYMDNVRIKYTGQNNATGYAYGIDTRLYGGICTGCRFLDFGFLCQNMKILRIKAISQDPRISVLDLPFLPGLYAKFPKMRVNLTGVFAMGLPTSSTLQQSLPISKNFAFL
jgi:hypothetical protein